MGLEHDIPIELVRENPTSALGVSVDFKSSTRIQGTVTFSNLSDTAVFRMPVSNRVEVSVNESGQW